MEQEARFGAAGVITLHIVNGRVSVEVNDGNTSAGDQARVWMV